MEQRQGMNAEGTPGSADSTASAGSTTSPGPAGLSTSSRNPASQPDSSAGVTTPKAASTSTGVRPTTDGAGRSSSDGADSTAQFARERAGALWDDAKETARSKLNEQKDAAAQGIGQVAGALRDSARQGRSKGDGDAFSSLTGTAADGLERLSSTLRTKDVGALLRDTEAFARSQPIAFFGLALAAGFLAVRFVKASNP